MMLMALSAWMTIRMVTRTLRYGRRNSSGWDGRFAGWTRDGDLRDGFGDGLAGRRRTRRFSSAGWKPRDEDIAVEGASRCGSVLVTSAAKPRVCLPALAPVSWRFRDHAATLFNATGDMKALTGMADRTTNRWRFPGAETIASDAFWRLEDEYSDPGGGA